MRILHRYRDPRSRAELLVTFYLYVLAVILLLLAHDSPERSARQRWAATALAAASLATMFSLL